MSRSAHSNTEHWEENSALSLSVSPSVTQVCGFFPLTFRVSSASGLFFTLVCSTYLLTSRVLVNVGFVQTWCLVECDSRLCLSEIFFSFLNLLNQESVWHFLAVFHKKKGSSGIKLYNKLISYTHTHTHTWCKKKKKKKNPKKIIHTDHKKITSWKKKVMLRWKLLFITFYFIIATACVVFIVAKLVLYIVRLLSWSKPLIWSLMLMLSCK